MSKFIPTKTNVDSSEKRMLITIFLPSARAGGAERTNINLANELALMGYEVDLLISDMRGDLIGEVAPNINLINLNCSRILFSIWKLTKYLYKFRPMMLISVLDHANIAAILSRILAFSGTFLVVTEHSTPSKAVLVSLFDHLIFGLKGIIYNFSNVVVCVSSGSANDLICNFSVAQKKVKTIYNPIITNDFRRTLTKLDSGNIKKIPIFRYVIGAGRLVFNKDFSTLIYGFARANIDKNIKLVIIGEGHEHDMLLELAASLKVSDRVKFVGHVTNPLTWIYHAELFVLSSRFEGLPTVVIEALACNTPVISTDCQSGPSEILEKGLWGSLFQVGDYETLAKLIEKSLNTTIKLHTRDIAERYSSRVAAIKYLELLKQ